MEILTLTQPWATLVAVEAKHIETRSWATSYRGPIAIHAGKGLGPVGGERALQRLCQREPFWGVLCDLLMPPGRMLFAADTLPRGAIVAVAELVDCVGTLTLSSATWRTTPQGRAWPLTDQERAFGDYSPGRYAWLLADVRRLSEPLPYRGAQGLRSLPADVAAEVEARIRAQLNATS